MKLQRYDFPFCSVAVPPEWVPVPPLTLAERGEGEGRISARVTEVWEKNEVDAASRAQRDRDNFAAVLEDFALIREGPHPAHGAKTGHALIFEYEDEERLTAREMRVYLARGTHLVTLILLGPGEAHRERDALFAEIAQSFTLQGDAFLERVEPGPLFPTSAILPDPAALRQSFPRLCSSLPVPRGWNVQAEGGEVVLSRSGVEIRLRRVLEHAPDPAIWFKAAMERLRETPGSIVLRQENGSLPDGRPMAGVLFDETARTRSWSTAAALRTLAVGLASGDILIEAVLEAPVNSMPDLQGVLFGVLSGLELLPSSEWETCPIEPWLQLTLRGPWTVEGPGTYARLDSNLVLLQLGRTESTASIESLRPRLIEGLRRAHKVQRNPDEKTTSGLLRGMEALRYAGQGKMVIRALWLRTEGKLHSCVFQAGDATEADELFTGAVEGLRVPGMEARGQLETLRKN